MWVNIMVILQKVREVIKFFMLNSTEYEVNHANRCYNANNFWHFNIYEHDKYKLYQLHRKSLLDIKVKGVQLRHPLALDSKIS